VADRDGLRAEREALRDVAPVADAARDDEVDLVREADVLERAARLGDRRHQRECPVSSVAMCGPCARRALGAVEVDDVGAALRRHAHVVVDARAPSFSWIGMR
jgi:hypothetical protein